jgi:hypothetical protein
MLFAKVFQLSAHLPGNGSGFKAVIAQFKVFVSFN